MSNLFIKAVGGLLYIFVSISALIFLPAWTFNYWQAWTFLALFSTSFTAIFIYLAKNDPALLARRVKATEKERSQKVIRFFINLSFTVVIVLSAFDHRFAWLNPSSFTAAAGDAIVALGMLIVFLVFKENTFTAQTVEVEAGQTVVSTGPYALVRHPMYVGGLVFMLGIPLALGSWWGLVAAVLFAPVMAWRIREEERLLAKDLLGYPEYCERVKIRFVPFVW
jgi:protein-S-isoprenylcysteine O-methyltransferase Ste14